MVGDKYYYNPAIPIYPNKVDYCKTNNYTDISYEFSTCIRIRYNHVYYLVQYHKTYMIDIIQRDGKNPDVYQQFSQCMTVILRDIFTIRNLYVIDPDKDIVDPNQESENSRIYKLYSQKPSYVKQIG